MLKKLLYFFVIAIFSVKTVSAVSFPSPVGLVNDFAGIYSQDFRSKLETQFSDFNKQKGVEFALVTIKSLEGLSASDYANRLFEQWKIGKKGEDNGLLVLIAVEDRDFWIEVGYGLEPYITDGRAGEIYRTYIVPEFKNGNYETGTTNTVMALEKYISDKDIAPKVVTTKSGNFPLVPILAGIYFIGTYLASFLGRSKEIWPGGVVGLIIGIIAGLLLGSIIVGIGLGLFAGLFGLFMDFILSKNYKTRASSGKSTDFWSSGGGFFGGGGGFGGGSGGGGFGGFGGGSSGGGGGGGKW
jgi:uncharacterized protein